MATDTTAPYNRVIAITAVGAVIFLIGLKFALDSYYVVMTEEAAFEKLASTSAVDKHRAEEQRLLTTAPTPIRAAMADVGRSRNISPIIEPRPSEDIGALKGWAAMERVFEAPPAKAAPNPQIPPMSAAGDAGAPVAPGGPAPVVPVPGAPPVAPHAPIPHH